MSLTSLPWAKKRRLAVAALVAVLLIMIAPALWFVYWQGEDAYEHLDGEILVPTTESEEYPLGTGLNEPEPLAQFAELWSRPYRGAWNGNIWTSEYLGLYFYLPRGWEHASDEEISKFLDFDTARAPDGAGMTVTDEFWEMEDAALSDMKAIELETLSSVSVAMERMPELGFGVEEFIKYNIELFDQFAPNVNADVEPRQIGAFEWAGFEFYTDATGPGNNITHFVRVIDGFAVIILVQIFDDYGGTVDDFLRLFGYVGDAPEPSWEPLGSIMRGILMDGFIIPALEQPDSSHPLVGTWSWNLDSGFVYNFYGDGTGTRGFDDEIESFTWETSGDHLVIRLPFMDESWTFSINGIMLTIDSRQVAGMAWRYIRRWQ